MKKTMAAVLCALLILCGCAAAGPGMQQPMPTDPAVLQTQLPPTEDEVISFDMANTYFTWAYQDLGEEFFVEYRSEETAIVQNEECRVYTARTQEEILCYAAVPAQADRLFIRLSPDAPWQLVEPEVWDMIDNQAQ